jgi:hypothetical protein
VGEIDFVQCSGLFVRAMVVRAANSAGSQPSFSVIFAPQWPVCVPTHQEPKRPQPLLLADRPYGDPAGGAANSPISISNKAEREWPADGGGGGISGGGVGVRTPATPLTRRGSLGIGGADARGCLDRQLSLCLYSAVRVVSCLSTSVPPARVLRRSTPPSLPRSPPRLIAVREFGVALLQPLHRGTGVAPIDGRWVGESSSLHNLSCSSRFSLSAFIKRACKANFKLS